MVSSSSEYEMGKCGNLVCAVNGSERLSKLVQDLGMTRAQLTAEQQHQLHQILNKYSDVSALCDAELGCTSLVQHSIEC